MPVIDKLAAEYGDRVAFIAPAWKGTMEATAQRAAELMPSGKVRWGLDAEEAVFAAFGVPYQPHTVLITADGVVAEAWAGVRSEEAMRRSIEALLARS